MSYKNLNHYKNTVHLYLDGIWGMSSKPGRARTSMYKWLAIQMNISEEDAHVSKFTRAQCRKAISILRPKYIAINGKDIPYKTKNNKKKE